MNRRYFPLAAPARMSAQRAAAATPPAIAAAPARAAALAVRGGGAGRRGGGSSGMVVVEAAGERIGSDTPIVVRNVIKTATGRMVFANLQ